MTSTRREIIQGVGLAAAALPAAAALAAVGPGADHHPLLALWREVLALTAACNASGDEDQGAPHGGPIRARLRTVEKQIEAARPSDPVGLAVQARYLERWLDRGAGERQIAFAGAIAATLAGLGGAEIGPAPNLRREDWS